MTTITVGDKNILVHLDICGNVYFEYNNNISQLCIDRNDEPYLDFADYPIIEPNDESSEVVRGTIIATDTFKDDRYFVEDNGKTFTRKNIKDEYELELEDPYLDDAEIYFIFYEKNGESTIPHRQNGDIPALYDTYIYDDTTDESSNLIFSAKINTENSIYRAIIYKSGKFYFRPIGCTSEKSYRLQIIDDKVICEKII
jgi:hypothetical protein